MKVRTLSIDLAKNVFSVHGVDNRGKTVLHRELRRRQLLAFIRQLQPCLGGNGGVRCARYWARETAKLGHEVRLMSPQFAATVCEVEQE
jgi:transposase